MISILIMYRGRYIMLNYSIAETKNNLSQLVHKVEEGEVIQITRRGQSVAVLLSLDDFKKYNQLSISPANTLKGFLQNKDFQDVDIEASIFDELRATQSGRAIEL